MRTIRFGLNYVPSRNWYYSWNDWQKDAVARDFDAIAKLGADHIRVMLVWPWFQPNPAVVSPAHLERLGELMGLARERGLEVMLCPVTGWLSGYLLFPPGVTGADVFVNEKVYERVTRYFAAVLKSVEQFENFLGFDLGNEINCITHTVTSAQGDTWGRRITAWLSPQMKGKWIVNGVDHQPWFYDRGFGTKHLVEDYDVTTIHAWPEFTSCLRRGGLADLPSRHLSAFLTHLSRQFQRQAGVNKPVWIQEFGCSGLWGTPEEKEIYLRHSVALAVQAGATMFTWWASHDIDRAFTFDALEYDLGLLTVDNEPKPLAHVFRELVGEWSAVKVTLGDPLEFLPGVPADFQPQGLPVPEGTHWIDQGLATKTWQHFDRYLERFKTT